MMSGLDGWEVPKRIKEDASFPDVPVSMLSVRGSIEDMDKSLNYAHADVHLSKPIDFYLLNKTVSSLIESYGKGPKKPGRLGPRPKESPSDLLRSSDSKNN
jgi:CheY-like chemotaxis protein